jgi:hypothetical protein
MQPEDYMSFLVRLWGDHSSNDGPDGRQGEIEHIQTGTRWHFTMHSELLAFLHQLTVASQAVTQPVSEESFDD